MVSSVSDEPIALKGRIVDKHKLNEFIPDDQFNVGPDNTDIEQVMHNARITDKSLHIDYTKAFDTLVFTPTCSDNSWQTDRFPIYDLSHSSKLSTLQNYAQILNKLIMTTVRFLTCGNHTQNITLGLSLCQIWLCQTLSSVEKNLVAQFNNIFMSKLQICKITCVNVPKWYHS